VSSRELLEFLEGSDDDDRDRRKRRRRKPRMWRSARERASWKSDMRQVNPNVADDLFSALYVGFSRSQTLFRYLLCVLFLKKLGLSAASIFIASRT